MTTVEFKFDIGADVTIVSSNVKGKVEGLFLGKYGQKQYSVEYNDANGLVTNHWFDEDQLR